MGGGAVGGALRKKKKKTNERDEEREGRRIRMEVERGTYVFTFLRDGIVPGAEGRKELRVEEAEKRRRKKRESAGLNSNSLAFQLPPTSVLVL